MGCQETVTNMKIVSSGIRTKMPTMAKSAYEVKANKSYISVLCHRNGNILVETFGNFETTQFKFQDQKVRTRPHKIRHCS